MTTTLPLAFPLTSTSPFPCHATLLGTALMTSPVTLAHLLTPMPPPSAPFFVVPAEHVKKSTPRGLFMLPHANRSHKGCHTAWKVVSHLPVWGRRCERRGE